MPYSSVSTQASGENRRSFSLKSFSVDEADERSLEELRGGKFATATAATAAAAAADVGATPPAERADVTACGFDVAGISEDAIFEEEEYVKERSVEVVSRKQLKFCCRSERFNIKLRNMVSHWIHVCMITALACGL